ncbi:MAG TPA: ABC transporter ATP-binding protein [Actinomycetota bacterium]|nr:ABC transporter ATP-binding protein [Actinomycetota bacterium]
MQRSALRRVFSIYARPFAGRLVVVFGVATVALAASVSIPRVIKQAVDLVAGIHAGTIAPGELGKLWIYGAVLLGLASAEVVLAYIRRNTAARVSLQMETKLRDDFYRHLQSLQISFHDNWQSGQLLSRAIYDINAIRRFVGFGAIFFGLSLIQLAGVFAMLWSLDSQLAVLTFISVSPILWFSYRFGSGYRVVAKRIQDEQGDLSTLIEESASGIRIIKAFGRGALVLGNFSRQASKLRDSNLDAVKLRRTAWSTFGFFANLSLPVILLVGGFAVVSGRLTIGGLVAFMAYLSMLIFPFDILGWILAMGEEARTAADRVFEVLDAKPEIQDRPGARALPHAQGRVAFEGIWFRYSDESDWILRDVNLEIEPGETLALVGKTGCGKTTLASLLPRLYDATEGKVTLDDNDVRDLTLTSLRSHIGMAFEDPILFSASVTENILMGRPDATDDDLRSALQTAQADFAHELPWGLDTRIGEQGYTLSGGQRQRLALARAVLGAPQVLVLDDPLSAVDVHTEAMIEDALRTVLDGVTALLVVHRPSTLALADRVALLDNGTIVAIGKHHDLMENVPLYRAILSQEAEEMQV